MPNLLLHLLLCSSALHGRRTLTWWQHGDGSQDLAQDSRFLCGGGEGSPGSDYIIGGQEATPHSYPWIARIFGGCAKGLCAGTLVTSRHLLYAFHCTYDTRRGDGAEGPCDHSDGQRTAVFGLHMFDYWKADQYYTRKIIDVKVPPHFGLDENDNLSHDFALGVLNRPVEFSDRIRPICIPEQGMEFYGEKAMAAGWGSTKSGSEQQSPFLKDVELRVSKYQYEHIKMLGTEVMGEGGQSERDPCRGDSGGPLMWQSPENRWLLIGTVHGGGFDCKYGKYNFFENSDNGIWNNVAEQSDWIKQAIADSFTTWR